MLRRALFFLYSTILGALVGGVASMVVLALIHSFWLLVAPEGFTKGYWEFAAGAALLMSIVFAFVSGLASFWYEFPSPPGTCDSCAYNLRGLTEPRCPACGTPFDPQLLATHDA